MFCGRLLLFFFLLVPTPGQAKQFHNSYLQFELPDQWNCSLRKKAYLCRHRISKSCRANPTSADCKKQIKKSREAVIVISAKEKSQVDSMAAYLSHFGEARKLDAAGGTTQSKVVHNKIVGIQKQKWVDGMHLGSELPHYYTRYLATIKGEVAVLVSFTAHKLFYTNYSNQFFQGIKSLQVIATQLSKMDKQEIAPAMLSRPIDIPDELFETQGVDEQGEGEGLSTVLFLLSIGLAAAGAFIWFRSKKAA